MKHAFLLLFSNLTSLACAIGAIYLASLGITGWGWFLFDAMMTTSHFRLQIKKVNKTPLRELILDYLNISEYWRTKNDETT